jgi:hypothetical protein
VSRLRMLDLFAGRLGWMKAFLARGWDVTAVDLVEPPEIPQGVTFVKLDVMKLQVVSFGGFMRFWTTDGDEPNPLWEHPRFDFVCASSPCEEFSVHGMPHFHPNPKYPDTAIRLFQHTRQMCEFSWTPYIMENVRAAQKFVGRAVNHCGPFYLWGNAVPPLMPQGICKGISQRVPNMKSLTRAEITAWRRVNDPMWSSSKGEKRQQQTAKAAKIPPELAHCVAEYAERLLETRQ